MPIKKALLALGLIALVGSIFVFTVYYYKTVLSTEIYTESPIDNNISVENKTFVKPTEKATATLPNLTDIKPIETQKEAEDVLKKIQATSESNKKDSYKSMSEFDENRARMLEYMNK